MLKGGLCGLTTSLRAARVEWWNAWPLLCPLQLLFDGVEKHKTQAMLPCITPVTIIRPQEAPLYLTTTVPLSCSDERARRVSTARADRAVQYRFSRMAHAVRLQTALQQQREAEAAAASSSEAELQPADAAVSSHINLIIKADVQARSLLHLPCTVQGSPCRKIICLDSQPQGRLCDHSHRLVCNHGVKAS